jgi:membrane peptidoglycan carboxypeptidase
LGLLGVATIWEARTSTLQSLFFAHWDSALKYTIAPGPSDGLAFPLAGPFDDQRGYTHLPAFLGRLEARGFGVTEQARQTPALARLIRMRVDPPYREPSSAGLVIRDAGGLTLYNPATHDPVFRDFEQIPRLLVETLLFIENRSIGDQAGPHENPAVDWPRSTKAFVSYVGRGVGFDIPLEGGSTLATQLEKYRHSPAGRTSSPAEKLRQMIGASLKAYQGGRDTRGARKQIIMDYLNTMPLGAVPGMGEVHGLGEGLRAWFGLDFADIRAALERPQPDFQQASAFRHVLALLCAVRAPTNYLVKDRSALEARADAYTRLLHAAGVIDSALFVLLQQTPLEFVSHGPTRATAGFVERKAINAVRFEVANLLGTPALYDLDKLHLQVESTFDAQLQDEITRLLSELASSAFVAANGLRGPHMLAQGDPRAVTYSFLLVESRPQNNLVRVHADTLNAPFDFNESMKLELGSTAKLRTLAHYLEIVARLHDELSGLDAETLARRKALARDPLTDWAAATLTTQPDMDPGAFLSLALERRYSASPAEAFFTGGGIHRFKNFDAADNSRVLTVREATIHSTNLVYIRLLRDIVRFYQARLPYDTRAVLERYDDPKAKRLLEQIADREARQILLQSYRRYRQLSPQEIPVRFLGRYANSARHWAMLFYAWQIGAGASTDGDAPRNWLQAHVGTMKATDVRRLEGAYDNPRLTITDFGYLLRRHPLELWSAGELARNPGISWEELLAHSEQARQRASAWLFETRNRRAQDLRLRTQIERDAFARMTPYWRSLGFPFESLVPSYATAIGSSADQPTALADLMGIIVNNGVRRPIVDIRRLGFALDTPYHSVLEMSPGKGEQVMRARVAELLREVLGEVVERGTARRLNHAWADNAGAPIIIGGKTGSGDNRIQSFGPHARLISSRVTSRTASFVFYLGERWFGVITASVSGPQAASYTFTSTLPLAVLRLLLPTLCSNERIACGHVGRSSGLDPKLGFGAGPSSKTSQPPLTSSAWPIHTFE